MGGVKKKTQLSLQKGFHFINKSFCLEPDWEEVCAGFMTEGSRLETWFEMWFDTGPRVLRWGPHRILAICIMVWGLLCDSFSRAMSLEHRAGTS